jgi:hypothetical protein
MTSALPTLHPHPSPSDKSDPEMAIGWVRNAINNALKPVYAAAADLCFRRNAGEEGIFAWSVEIVAMFQEVVGFLGSLDKQADKSVRSLLN